MAVKKTTKKKEVSAAPTKAEAKETAPKKTTKAKAAAPVAPVAAEPAKAAKPKAAAPKKAAAKKAVAPIKLTASQTELFKKIHAAAEKGYFSSKKVEARSLATLLEKKLIKKGAKDKATGMLAFHLSNGGKQYGDSNF